MTDLSGAPDAESVERIATVAIAQATATFHWRRIVGALEAQPLASRERVGQVAQRLLERALVEHDGYAVVDVARVRSGLDDRHGVYVALEEAIEMMRTVGAPGGAWVRISDCFVLVEDPAEQLRCLEIGRDALRSRAQGAGLVEVATAWAVFDREAGLALMHEAETILGKDEATPWSLANAWIDLDEPAQAWRVLERAQASAADTSAAIHVARAYACHANHAGVALALVRGGALAATVAHWLALGEAAYDCNVDVATIRAALQSAEQLASDDTERARIAMGYKVWLLDNLEAERFGPRGVRPEASDLFDLLRDRATPELLETIARADYGMDFQKHLAGLADICATGLVPRDLPWEPREVLELTRWQSGEHVDHLARALSCVILLIANPDSDSFATNAPILVESCFALGAETTAAAAALFEWSATSPPTEDEPLLPALALVLLAIVHANDANLDEIATRLAANVPDHLAATMFDGIRGALWRELVTTRLVPRRTSCPPIDHVLIQLDLS